MLPRRSFPVSSKKLKRRRQHCCRQQSLYGKKCATFSPGLSPFSKGKNNPKPVMTHLLYPYGDIRQFRDNAARARALPETVCAGSMRQNPYTQRTADRLYGVGENVGQAGRSKTCASIEGRIQGARSPWTPI